MLIPTKNAHLAGFNVVGFSVRHMPTALILSKLYIQPWAEENYYRGFVARCRPQSSWRWSIPRVKLTHPTCGIRTSYRNSPHSTSRHPTIRPSDYYHHRSHGKNQDACFEIMFGLAITILVCAYYICFCSMMPRSSNKHHLVVVLLSPSDGHCSGASEFTPLVHQPPHQPISQSIK